LRELEDRLDTTGLIRNGQDLRKALEVCGAPDGFQRCVAGGAGSTQDDLVGRAPRHTHTRAEALVPAGRNRIAADASGAGAAEHERAAAAGRAGVRHGGIEIRALAVVVDRGQVEFIAQSQIEGEARGDAPVVLKIHGVIAPVHADSAWRVDGHRSGVAQ